MIRVCVDPSRTWVGMIGFIDSVPNADRCSGGLIELKRCTLRQQLELLTTETVLDKMATWPNE